MDMKKTNLWVGVVVGVAAAGVALTTVSSTRSETVVAAEITVYKSPSCGCCSKWIEHLEANGFTVKAEDVADISAVKSEFGVPSELGSCHTAMVDGYLVEGHVPAQSIKRLLTERPQVAGLAVPGMPVGSPGMEGANPQRYNVVAFDAAGGQRIFESY
jgi:hypothetical protein